MPGVARVSKDSAGGKQLGQQAPTVFVNNEVIVVLGDNVAGHGPGAHGGPKMAQGSSTVFANGIAVSREGDKATCGHASTGSSDVFAD